MQKPIYLDYMATTPVDPRVVKKLIQYMDLDGCFGNPHSTTHAYGKQANLAIETATAQLADLISADPKEIVWTSGATEANNLAILGAARANQHRGKHIIACKTEHKSVLAACAQLEKEGFSVTYLTPKITGLIDLADLQSALQPDTILVSIMHVNSEIGVIQDINAIGQLTRSNGSIFHVDAAQSLGKLDINLVDLAVDLMSFSGHKMYAPKGIGALYISQRPRCRLQALTYGGGQQLGLRPGTLPTQQIVAMGEACVIAKQEMHTDQQRIQELTQQLWSGLQQIAGVELNATLQQRIPGNLNIYIPNVDAESLMLAANGIAISAGSACNAMVNESSYVIRGIGHSPERAFCSVRICLGKYTTASEVATAIEILQTQTAKLREIAIL